MVDADLQQIIEPKEIYSGMFCRISLSCYCWEYGGKKGISFGLGNIQKTRDGDPLGGGGVRADKEFDAWTNDDDDVKAEGKKNPPEADAEYDGEDDDFDIF